MKKASFKVKWTLVQHSGYLVAGKLGFKNAVEQQHVSTQAEADKVLKAGGILSDSYPDDMDVNYPPEVSGMYPRCRGTFSSLKVDGRPIYIPHPDEKAELEAAS